MPGVVVNISSVAEGQQFAPGNEVLMPFEEAGKAWAAHNGGAETWKTYLAEIEPKLTLKSYEALCRVTPLERKALALSEAPLLHLVPNDNPVA